MVGLIAGYYNKVLEMQCVKKVHAHIKYPRLVVIFYKRESVKRKLSFPLCNFFVAKYACLSALFALVYIESRAAHAPRAE